LINANADLEEEDTFGNTPLICAAENPIAPPVKFTSASHLIKRSTTVVWPPLDARVKGVYSSLL
jgi:hypothetical protein